MRRLYSTFAVGLPGVGLLLMRLVAGIVLVSLAAEVLFNASGTVFTNTTSALLAALGILLIAGLWTPVAGTLIAMISLAQLVRTPSSHGLHLLLATIAGSLAMLGPGVWSIDAWLFGWRRVEPRPSNSNSSRL